MSDTPRTDDAEYFSYDSEPPESLEMVDVAFARQLERELFAANERIKNFESAFCTVENIDKVKAYQDLESANERIKRLEEENDAMRADLLLWREQDCKP